MRFKAVSHHEVSPCTYGVPGRYTGSHCPWLRRREREGGHRVDQRFLGLPGDLFLSIRQRLSEG